MAVRAVLVSAVVPALAHAVSCSPDARVVCPQVLLFSGQNLGKVVAGKKRKAMPGEMPGAEDTHPAKKSKEKYDKKKAEAAVRRLEERASKRAKSTED